MDDRRYWEDNWDNNKQWPVSNFAQKVYTILKENNLKKILDIGCGNGRDSLYFAGKCFNITALDFSDSGTKILKDSDIKKKIKCVNQDIRDINFPAESFDAIYSHLSLHYFTDEELEKILKKLHNILKKDGYIFIKCKSTKDSLYGIGQKGEADMFFYKHWRHFFTKNYMEKKLGDFSIVEIDESETSEYGFHSAFVEAIARKES